VFWSLVTTEELTERRNAACVLGGGITDDDLAAAMLSGRAGPSGTTRAGTAWP
jgi:hypothetical protein